MSNEHKKYQMSYREFKEKITMENRDRSNEQLSEEILQANILLSMALQKFEKLGLLGEFYDDLKIPIEMRTALNRLKNSIKLLV